MRSLDFFVLLHQGKRTTVNAFYILYNLNKVITENQYLNDESNIQRIDKESNSYFKLSIKPNRFTTNNIPNSKIRIIFLTETIGEETPQYIWTGASSCFKFINKETILNDIYYLKYLLWFSKPTNFQ